MAAALPLSRRPYISVYKIYLRGILMARADVELAVTDSNTSYRLYSARQVWALYSPTPEASPKLRGNCRVQSRAAMLHYSWTGDDSINFARLDYADGAPVGYETYKSENRRKCWCRSALRMSGPARDPFLSLLVRQGPEEAMRFAVRLCVYMTGAALPS